MQMEYYSAIKKNVITPSANFLQGRMIFYQGMISCICWTNFKPNFPVSKFSRMDLEIIILSEVSQRKTSIIWYHFYVESKKMIQVNLFTNQKQTHRRRKQTYSY